MIRIIIGFFYELSGNWTWGNRILICRSSSRCDSTWFARSWLVELLISSYNWNSWTTFPTGALSISNIFNKELMDLWDKHCMLGRYHKAYQNHSWEVRVQVHKHSSNRLAWLIWKSVVFFKALFSVKWNAVDSPLVCAGLQKERMRAEIIKGCSVNVALHS